MAHWEHYEHGADIGIRGVGNTLEEAFVQAALALTAVITDPALVKPEQQITISCEAPDLELLFVDWLNAIILEMASLNMLFSQFEITLNPPLLMAQITGEAIDIQRHQPVVEIKGATYTTLSVTQNSLGEWCAQTVVDV